MKQFLALAVIAFCAIATEANHLCGGTGLLCQPVPLGGHLGLDDGLALGYGHAPVPLALSPVFGGGLGHLKFMKKYHVAPKPLLLSIAPVAPVAPIAFAAAPILPTSGCGCHQPLCPPCHKK